MSDNITESADSTNLASISSHFDVDINVIQDKLLNATLTPINYVWEV